MRHLLPAVPFLLASLVPAQAPAPESDWLARTVAAAPPEVRVAAVLHEPVARLATRLTGVLTAADRATVDDALAASSGLDAVLARLADHVGPQSVWFVGFPFEGQTAPGVVVSFSITGPGAHDAVRCELDAVANHLRQREGAHFCIVRRNGSKRHVYEVYFGEPDRSPSFAFEVTEDTLRIGTSAALLLGIGRVPTDRFGALVQRPVAAGRARVAVDLDSSDHLRTWLVRATAKARGVQALLDVFGGGGATLDVELDSIDRFAVLAR